MAEEQRLQESHRLCTNNCGFFGSPATSGLCSKCFRGSRLDDENASAAKIAVEKSLHTAASSSSSAAVLVPSVAAVEAESLDLNGPSAGKSREEECPSAGKSRRCATCSKRVRLTAGFRCRCGETYCGAHRYPDQHGCGFDFKSAGRKAIARDNPVVRADKLDRI